MSFEKPKSAYIYNTSTFYDVFIVTSIKYHWDKVVEVEAEFRNTAKSKQPQFLDFCVCFFFFFLRSCVLLQTVAVPINVFCKTF